MKLKVWWIPQVPMKAFEREVPNLATAKILLEVLADYDAFQYENRIKPDYANAGGLLVWDEALDGDDKWTDWESDDFDSIDDMTLEQCIEKDAELEYS